MKQKTTIKAAKVRRQLGWWEMKMMVLLIFIVAMLTTGKVLQKQQTPSAMAMVKPGLFWQWQVPLSERLGVTFTDPWLMQSSDLTRERVVYNWLTKPGFRWLIAEGVLGIGLVWLMSWALATAWVWQKQKLLALQRAWTRLAHTNVEVRIHGSVAIRAGHGLIYVSSAGRTAQALEGEEYFGLVFARVEIRLVEG